ncbi:hypothetical protein J4E83_003325 [Alternaria metachromatica]|uniref:uncharacterized protein n=1 Tax=Alternaria metachromatica TaxID=283354 RepID=UPI0020C582F7|nr:uncharacterized protein J4E83_003325 [Alternaria metachromatica]KAI4628772.1 hypothetical protein J4E83_003325 [Alternaria metachromatica]
MAFNKRGPNNFAHWNMFPFMTMPKTKYILGQTQSPFFRLPREIRDTIYEYYAQGRPQYVYDKNTTKLRYSDASAQAEGLGLMMTCKIAADEMKHVAFQNIEFSTLCSANDGAEFQQLRSRVARFSQFSHIPQKRLNNLRKLIICEDFKSRPRSVCHARGLIPICRANPNLKIERHINLLDSLLPVDQPNGYRGGRSSIGSFNVMEAAVPWFAETPLLRTHGMPEGSFQLVIDGTSREALEVWNVIKHAAAMQGAMLEQCRVRNTHPTSRLYDSIAGRIYGPTALPWHLPDGFSDTIRRTIEGTTNITFTGDMGELWDEDVFYFQRRDWTLDQWRHEWRSEIT